MEIQIRLAGIADLSSIENCAVAAYSKYIQRMGKEPAPMQENFSAAIDLDQVSVVLRDHVFAGYVLYYEVDNSMQLDNVAVLPKFAGEGIGKCLIKHVESQAFDAGVDCVKLYTNEAMTENIAWYAALGYSEYKRSTDNGFRRVYFIKSILN